MNPCSIVLLISIIQWSTYSAQPICSFHDVVQNLSKQNIPGSAVRPVKDWRTPTTVYIDLSLYTVVSLDTSLQSLTTYIWFAMEWQNEFIKWDPDKFCGIDTMIISGQDLWLPDLYIYEMTEADGNSPVIPYFTISSDGYIKDSKPLRIVSTCNLDIFKFPFDIQSCNLTFGPYIHAVQDIIMLPKFNSSDVNINSQEIFVSKGDWSLLDISVSNSTIWSEGVAYSQVIYQITIKRAPVVYIINLIIPSCFLVLLDIVSMFIQMGTGERLGFKITVVLGFSVLLLILNDMLPNSDNPAVLGVFCCVCLAVMVISTIGSIITSYMLMLSESKPSVPNWIKVWIMRRLARALCFKVQTPEKHKVVIKVEENGYTADRKKPEKTPDNHHEKGLQKEKDSLEVRLLKRLLVEILLIHQELIPPKDKQDAKTEWYTAALIVDRLVLILYLIIVIVMFAVVMSVWLR
ncbi:5-hydroxytryptamine receptor 3A-like [Leptodactylus fuscus]|uniref:5-hydroxytryptamine receptor 3A-like n=1 Tax=Leptodactylus fuscus TaxID=238119 RepID=UPI003F4EC469